MDRFWQVTSAFINGQLLADALGIRCLGVCHNACRRVRTLVPSIGGERLMYGFERAL
jgi:hypothetical protein